MAQHNSSLEKTLQSVFKHKRAGTEVATAILGIEAMVLSGIDTTAIVENSDVKKLRRARATVCHKAFGKRIVDSISTLDAILAQEQYDTGVKATAVLNLTADITLTAASPSVARNTSTFTIQVLAAAANPTNTVLVAFTGTSAAITCTVTPNDGTNNSATPVDLTTAELVELVNTGAVVGKSITLTDASSLRALQTAAGGDATALADAGEGDGVSAAFAGGIDQIAAAEDVVISGPTIKTQHKQKLRKVLVDEMAQKELGIEVSNMVDKAQKAVDLLLATYGVGGSKADVPTATALAAIKVILMS